MSDTKKRRDLSPMLPVYTEGVDRELPGGGRVRLVARSGNLAYLRKREQLEAAARARLNLSIEESLPLSEHVVINQTAPVGTILVNWSDFFLGEDELVSRREDGSLHEENGLRLLQLPPVAEEILDEIASVDALFAKNVEVAEKNSEAPSASA